MKLSEILHKLLLNYMERNRRMRHLKTESSFFKDHPNIYRPIGLDLRNEK